MLETTNLTNQFLIAMPALADPNFYHTVTYVCAHNDDAHGAILIVGTDVGDRVEEVRVRQRRHRNEELVS